jgi:hypothetical protein
MSEQPMGENKMCKKLKVAVIVEIHPYDVVKFQKMFESFEDCECYVQPLDLFVRDDDNKAEYDTVVYYNMNNPIPDKGSRLAAYLEDELGSAGQGVIILHHALLSYKRWAPFTKISGLSDRGEGEGFKYTPNESVNAFISDASHPITSGVADFTLIDETYLLGETHEDGNHVLITTDNATSNKNLAWVRQYKGSRVFCFASGHDYNAYDNPGFRKIVHNAILWTSGRI